MTRARLSPKAEADLEALFDHIATEDPQAALRVRNTILDTADLLAQHPGLGRRIRHASARHAQIRWFVVPRFRNYLMFYQPSESSVLVVRILHAAQDWTRSFPSGRGAKRPSGSLA